MNIKQIAEMAGVSRATVSRYLNDGYVSEDKRARIREVVERTGYVPSSQAQTLRTGKTRVVGVIMPKISSEAVSREVAGISQALDEAGYQLLLANTDNDATAEVRYLQVLTQSKVDGIILIATVFTPRHLRVIRELRVPFVILGQDLAGASCVYYDDYGSVHELAELVLRRSEHPAFLGVLEADKAAGETRRRAFEDAATAAGTRVQPGAIQTGEFTIESGQAMAKAVLDQLPHTDALVCATDSIAVGAMTYLKERGHRIPEDVQVTGIGDSRLAHVVSPTLTTAHFFYRTAGLEAGRLLVSMMADGDVASREVKMSHRLVVGASTFA